MGGEFPIKDRGTDEEGIIQVCMDGLSINFPSKQVRLLFVVTIRNCVCMKAYEIDVHLCVFSALCSHCTNQTMSHSQR